MGGHAAGTSHGTAAPACNIMWRTVVVPGYQIYAVPVASRLFSLILERRALSCIDLVEPTMAMEPTPAADPD
jgi:hypothetical protein